MSELLAGDALEAAVDPALAQLITGVTEHRTRLAEVERELVRVQARLHRWLAVISMDLLVSARK